MNKVLMLAFLAVALLSVETNANLLQFCGMVSHYTKRSCFDYINYGCWCGLGGKGKTVDEIDECCKAHDRCYGKNRKCNPKWNIYIRFWNRCWNKKGSCDYNVCMCDEEAAKCFAKHKYDKSHWGYRSKGQCLK
ncbi:unnamed protein product [Owenia fusiformis]|uniref:Phospholipase A2 n=1 Tax=Owenia fusiformis TaxID=6347 RepID=A0A8J1UZ08_OWEFU|nr:unnamed protein product [Owenia fusiformis]